MTYPGNQFPAESDLIKGCVDEDPQMLRLLYDRFSSMMYAVCIRYSDNTEDAKDIMQEGFIKVYKSLSKFRAEGSFEGWVRRIFINTSIEHYKKRIKLYNVSDMPDNTAEDSNLNAMDVLEAKDIMKLISELPRGYKWVFNLHVVEGYSHFEIALMLGITEGTSKSQLARGKGVLKKILISRKSYQK